MAGSCCNADQQFLIITTLCYLGGIFIMWRSPIFKPFKLFAVFLHELSHAIAATLCCNRVTGIEVTFSNEGGLCTYKGQQSLRVKCCVLPAGYLGSCMWGCGLVIACGFRDGARIAGIIVCVALLITFFYAICGTAKGMEERLTIIFLAVFFGVLCGGLVALDYLEVWDESYFLLEAVILFMGCTNMMYGTYDIYDDTVRRKDERSDAYKFAELAPCMFSRCVGAVWFLLAFAVCVASVVGVVIIAEDNGVGKDNGGACSNCLDFWKMIPALVVFGGAAGGTLFFWFLRRRGKSNGELGV